MDFTQSQIQKNQHKVFLNELKKDYGKILKAKLRTRMASVKHFDSQRKMILNFFFINRVIEKKSQYQIQSVIPST